MSRYAQVAFPLPLENTFTYEIPENMSVVSVGQRVLVPFQKRILTGYIVDLPAQAGEFDIKPIEAVLDDISLLTPSLIALAKKMAQLYGTFLGESLATVLPPGLIRQSRRRIFAEPKPGEPQDPEERALLKRIRQSQSLDWITLMRRSSCAPGALQKLQKHGWIRLETVLRKERVAKKEKLPIRDREDPFENAPWVLLSAAQETALATIVQAIAHHTHRCFLLHGVTGSGKTEIYLRAAAQALAKDRTVLALVPEISLTPQFVGRFRARFGNTVAILHSARNETERFSEWKRIRRKEAKVVIGARSAVFSPLENIGLIVVDEEHDSSYKQSEGLAYHAKTLATYRAEAEQAVLIYGSATPSLETYEASERGNIDRLELPQRVTGQDAPCAEVVDLREEFSRFGEKGMISNRLREALTNTLEEGSQAVLFLNRRGFAPLVFCPSCGESLRCKNCSVTLTYHEREKVHLCHCCGFSLPFHEPCPSCQQGKLIFLGVGTEKIERDLHFFFPDTNILRMDRDSVAKRGSHEMILRTFAKGNADILIGTQMVTKGMDLSNVSLVGVLLADQSLHFPDFRAQEQTFQLLTQVIGRSGRGKKRGLAIVQTFQPDHYAIRFAVAQDYKSFYAKEICFRKELLYPPFSSLVLLTLQGKELDEVQSASLWLAKQARSKIKELTDPIDVLGPSSAPLQKVAQSYRFHIIVRSSRGLKASAFARWLKSQAERHLAQHKVSIHADIDPYNFM